MCLCKDEWGWPFLVKINYKTIIVIISVDKYPHCPPSCSNSKTHIRLAYLNVCRLVIAIIASDIAVAPSSPMEFSQRL